MFYQLIWFYCLLIPVILKDIFNGESLHIKKSMSTQNSQNHKRQHQNNTEWLDELINKIENMKNKISNS